MPVVAVPDGKRPEAMESYRPEPLPQFDTLAASAGVTAGVVPPKMPDLFAYPARLPRLDTMLPQPLKESPACDATCNSVGNSAASPCEKLFTTPSCCAALAFLIAC